MKYAQIIMGTAGTGKSTYCRALQEHCSAAGRSMRVANMDPAADQFGYQVNFDVRELISVDDVMSEMQMGPNGALMYCMEYVADNMEWFSEQLEYFGEDDYLLLDCPGQIELYTHVPVMKRIADCLKSKGFNVCAVYCVDATFITDASKLISGVLTALSAMVHMELPHVNVLTKCDLADKTQLQAALSPSGTSLAAALHSTTAPKYRKLNEELAKLLDDYDMVSFLPLDITDEDSIDSLLLHVDHAIQYGEDAEPKEPRDEEVDEDTDDQYGNRRNRDDDDDDDNNNDGADRFPAEDGGELGFGGANSNSSSRYMQNSSSGGGDGSGSNAGAGGGDDYDD